jgi:hypothetical protein
VRKPPPDCLTLLTLAGRRKPYLDLHNSRTIWSSGFRNRRGWLGVGPLVPHCPLLAGMHKRIRGISPTRAIGDRNPGKYFLLAQSFLNRELLKESGFGCRFKFGKGLSCSHRVRALGSHRHLHVWCQIFFTGPKISQAAVLPRRGIGKLRCPPHETRRLSSSCLLHRLQLPSCRICGFQDCDSETRFFDSESPSKTNPQGF